MTSKIFGKLKAWLKKPRFLVIGALVIILVVWIAVRASSKPQISAVSVERGTVIQEVSVTGQVEAAQEVSLAFEKGGKIARVYKNIGDKASAGAPIAALEASELNAQLASAKASVDGAQAKLDELRRGSRPEEIAIKQTALDQANLTLTNAYADIFNTLENAYINADDAVRKQTDPFFNNDEQNNASLSFQAFNLQAQLDAENGRVAMTKELNGWKDELSGVGPMSSAGDLDQGVSRAEAHLIKIQDFLRRLGDVLVAQTNLPAATLTAYQTSLTAARTEVSSALSSITSVRQTLASDKLAVQSASDDLELAKAGSTPEAIRAQAAALEGAQANALNIQAQIDKTVIRAPIAGVVTEQDAKVGQIAAAQTPLVKMMSDGKFQITAQVAETDISRIASGKPVDITFDALPGENFTGTVVAVDPGETVLEGVATYKTTVSIDSPDGRIKPGMTANMDILVDRHDNVLWVPQRVVTTESGQRYVTVMNKQGAEEKREVKTGLRGQEGQIEIISGLSEGEQVLRSAQ